MTDERTRKDSQLCEKLGIQTICVGEGDAQFTGCSVDFDKAIRFALDLAKSEGIKVPSKLSVKLIADGREVGSTSSVLWGMQIMNKQMKYNLGSCHSVFPFAILGCGEDRSRMLEAIPDLIAQWNAYASKKKKKLLWDGQKIRISLFTALDLKSAWEFLDFGGIRASEKCPYCHCSQAQRHGLQTASERTAFGDDAIIKCDPHRVIFCTLHMLPRNAELLLERVVDRSMSGDTLKRGKAKTRRVEDVTLEDYQIDTPRAAKCRNSTARRTGRHEGESLQHRATSPHSIPEEPH